MNRYNTTSKNTSVRYDGKRVLRTTRYPTIPIGSTDLYIISSDGDYLDSLAKKYYKDESLWWVIAQANQIKGTMFPPPGTQLRIPGNVSSIVTNFYKENS